MVQVRLGGKDIKIPDENHVYVVGGKDVPDWIRADKSIKMHLTKGGTDTFKRPHVIINKGKPNECICQPGEYICTDADGKVYKLEDWS